MRTAAPAPDAALATPALAVVAAAGFDGEHLHTTPFTLRVRDGRIEGLDPGDHGSALAARGYRVLSVPFLLPGLIDAHVHLFLDGAPTDQAVRSAHLKQDVPALTEAARRSARQALACGITTVRDAGDRHGINNTVRQEAIPPTSGLCHVRSGGLGVKRAKRYGAFMAQDVDDAQSITTSVRALARANDEIKLILTGIIDFDAGAVTDEPQFDVDAARLVVATAHAAGRRVFAHCSGEKGLAVAAAAGVDSIEHGFFMTREVLAVMRDKGLAWTPTFCPVHFQWAEPQAVGWSANTVGNLRRILDRHAEHVRLAHEMGVVLLAGTDAGSMGVEHGKALWDELDRLHEAGLPVAACLAAATSAPRRHFGATAAAWAVGQAFDALALATPPDTDMRALRRPLAVWRDGVPCAPVVSA